SIQLESGIHRVQRVPATERNGRLHTSTASVCIQPIFKSLKNSKLINEHLKKDTVFEYFRASGPGGQKVNKTESAVRAKHIPSGIAVECQEERYKEINKIRAIDKLRERSLYVFFSKFTP
ncbi:MAG: hypothetical protein MHPSP_003684, partial [Paramarteilia canceri]